MDQQITARLEADLFLLHAPSVYDFRERDDMLFAYLSDSDSVNVTSIYEMYPIGWFSIKARLADHGFDAKIVNVASLMLMHPDLDIRRLLGRLEAPIFGFDLHWMTQCHGAIELAALLKEVHPEALTIFGGISATYYADQLIQYPSVDVVVQGYDTLEPVTELVTRVHRGSRDFAGIPNLLYKTGGDIRDTGFRHKPASNYNDAQGDWSYFRDTPNPGPATSKLIMTLPNTGCAHDCGWCGGSKFAYRNIMGVQIVQARLDRRTNTHSLCGAQFANDWLTSAAGGLGPPVKRALAALVALRRPWPALSELSLPLAPASGVPGRPADRCRKA